MDVQDVKEKARDIISDAGDYLDTLYQTAQVKLTKKTVNIAAHTISIVAMVILGFFSFIFLSVGLAFWLGQLINSTAGGFLIMGGFYVLLTVVLVVTKKSVVGSLRNKFVKAAYERKD